MNMTVDPPLPRRWRFFRAGGFDQVRIETGAELADLDQLDQKLWVALGCPIQGLEFDARTLAFLDLDQDRHIRAPELLAAIAWVKVRLCDIEALARPEPLALAAIHTGTPEGQRILASARTILTHLGKKEATHISVEEAAHHRLLFPANEPNGDGIIPPQLATDPAIQAVLYHILAYCGGEPDRSGELGVTAAHVTRFLSEATQYLQHYTQQKTEITPFGTETARAWQSICAVKDKINDYFVRCQLAAFDTQASAYLNSVAEDWQTIRAHTLTKETAAIQQLPLAHIEADRPLPLEQGLNPAWQQAMLLFKEQVCTPLFGPTQTTLTLAQWETILALFMPYEQALSVPEENNLLATISVDDLHFICQDTTKAAIDALIAQDLAVAEEANGIEDVEKLTRYCRDLMCLANNFVSFADFYQRKRKALFQAGTLYLDGRSCELCLYVTDPARHNHLASLSKLYLVYCDCFRGTEKIAIVAGFTAGDGDQLMVGRNGIFYDHQGQDWHATVTKIIDHPISLRQAFWSPYKKVGNLLSEQMQKFAAARAKAVEEKANQTLVQSTTKLTALKPTTAPLATPTPFDISKFAGIFAALGLAVGALGTAVASIFTGLLALKFWQMPLVFGGILLTVSGPSLVMAWFKLKARTLAPLLDANGWAINARAKINLPFGSTLTQVAVLPPHAERALFDPFAEKKTAWRWWIGLLGLLFLLLMVLFFYWKR